MSVISIGDKVIGTDHIAVGGRLVFTTPGNAHCQREIDEIKHAAFLSHPVDRGPELCGLGPQIKSPHSTIVVSFPGSLDGPSP